MEKKARVIEFRTGEGELIFNLFVFDRQIVLKDEPDTSKERGAKEEISLDSVPKTDESLMTDAQKRFLFRTLAEQGDGGRGSTQAPKRPFSGQFPKRGNQA